MKTKGKPWQFFVVAVLIVVFAFTAFLGISTQYGDTTKILGGRRARTSASASTSEAAWT